MSTVTESVKVIRSVRTSVPQRELARNIVTGQLETGLGSVRIALKSLFGKPYATVYNAIRRLDAKSKANQTVIDDDDSDPSPSYGC